jgi:hypothetical protein
MSEQTKRIDQIDSELDELQARRQTLLDERDAIEEADQRAREEAAGDPQIGDIVVVLLEMGDAKRGHVLRVRNRYTDRDRADRLYSALALDWPYGGSVTVPMSVVMKVSHPNAGKFFEQAQEGYYSLFSAVNETTGILPRIRFYE